MSLFEIYLGYLPPSPFKLVYGKKKDEARIQGDEHKARTFMEKIRQIHLRVQEQLEKSQ
jgi:hypothetical protein